MKKILSLLLLLYCLFFYNSVKGQSMHAINYTVKEGLSSNEVYWIIEASNGLIWIGCDGGLVSFDGVTFQSYIAPNTRNKSITGIHEDKNGVLWCHNFAGQIYYVENQEMHLLETWETYPMKDKLRGMYLKDGILTIKTGGHSQYYYNIKNHKITESVNKIRFALESGDTLLSTRNAFYQQKKGAQTQIACPECFYTWTPRGRHYEAGTFYEKNKLVFYIKSDNQRSTLKNCNGSILDLNVNVPFVYLMKQDTFHALHFPPLLAKYRTGLILQVVELFNDSTLYLGTTEGLFIWNFYTNEVQHFFKGDLISDVMLDHEGNLWITSLNQGVFFVPVVSLKLYDRISEMGVIHQIEKDIRGNLLIGYGNGKMAYWDIIKQEKLFEGSFAIKGPVNDIYYNEKQDIFWVSSSSKSYSFSPSTLNLNQEQYLGGAIKSMDYDCYGNILLALGHGVGIYRNPLLGEVRAIQLPASWKTSYSWRGYLNTWKRNDAVPPYLILDTLNTRSYSVLFQNKPQYTIWAGFTNGLKYYENGQCSELKAKNGKTIVAKSLAEVNDTTFWAGTLDDGIYCIQNKKIIRHLTIEEGLPSNEIQQLKINDNRLWVITSKGVVQYNLVEGFMKIWNKYNGLPSFNILDVEFLGENVYMTNGKSLISISKDFSPNETSPLIEITKLGINDSIYAPKEEYVLEYDQNNLQIHFRGISYRSQGDFQYQYKLHGIEENWNYISSGNNRVNYPDLGPGKYTFEIMVLNPSGEFSEAALVDILIKNPFYTAWWFILFWGLVFMGVISWLYNRQITKIKEQNEEKLQRSRLERDLRISELKALKAQLNPHFIFNALNSIQDYIIQNERELASDYLGMFADLMRLYLNHSQEGQISLKEEIDSLNLYLELEAIRLDENFSYQIKAEEGLDLYEIEIPTMLVQPYVENAIKHGLFQKKGEKRIEVQFKRLENGLILAMVRDNGVGRVAAEKYKAQKFTNHKSFATSANNARLKLLNYGRPVSIQTKITDLMDNGFSVGTEVQVIIPVNERD